MNNKNFWDMPISELMHSDVDSDCIGLAYIDLDEDEIMHWKYIKREKLPDGKYRYYYDESELEKSKQEALKADQAADQAEDTYEMLFYTTNNHTKEAYQEARRQAEGLRAIANTMRRNYFTKKIASFPERIISKGLVAIGNLISNLTTKKEKKSALGIPYGKVYENTGVANAVDDAMKKQKRKERTEKIKNWFDNLFD